MRRASVFVLSDVRSGSTLLDQCLGSHPDIVSLGELHWLPAYVKQDRGVYDPAHPLVCSCGKPVSECPFWTAVGKRLGRPLDELKLQTRFNFPRRSRSVATSLLRLPRRALRSRPTAFRFSPVQWFFGGPRMARDSVELYDAVSEVTGSGFCVDSSKSAFRFRAVYDREPEKTRAIVLARDYRAVVHSKMRHGAQLEVAARGWRKKMRQLEALTRDLPVDHVHLLKYESFCEDPRSELFRLCAFLGVKFADAMLQRATKDVHHIGGSPSKFDASRTHISLDRSYEGRFKGDELERLQRLVGNAAERWGY